MFGGSRKSSHYLHFAANGDVRSQNCNTKVRVWTMRRFGNFLAAEHRATCDNSKAPDIYLHNAVRKACPNIQVIEVVSRTSKRILRPDLLQFLSQEKEWNHPTWSQHLAIFGSIPQRSELSDLKFYFQRQKNCKPISKNDRSPPYSLAFLSSTCTTPFLNESSPPNFEKKLNFKVPVCGLCAF